MVIASLYIQMRAQYLNQTPKNKEQSKVTVSILCGIYYTADCVFFFHDTLFRSYLIGAEGLKKESDE